jgi:hypothetical protein
MFSTLSLSQQLDALAGSYTTLHLDCEGDLRVVQARPGGCPLILIGFDYAVQHGSLGASESDQLIAALRHAQAARLPVVLLANTSGVRVSEGNAGVAGLRRALRAALDAALDGVPMLALITRNCFGGASVLASLCERRLVNRSCLIGMSGPKLIEQLSGPDELVAADKDAVRALLGGEARAAASAGFQLIDDDAQAYGSALCGWLQRIEAGEKPGSLEKRRGALRERLLAAGRLVSAAGKEVADDPELAAVARHLLGRTPRLRRCGGFIWAEPVSGERGELLGLVRTASADAASVWRLSEALAAVPADARKLFLLLDCESHSAKAADERVVLSEYLACLALEARACHRRGVDVQLVVTGVSGGGIFAALAAGARTVGMLASARLQILPRAAMAAINKTEDESETTPARALETGAADHVLSQTMEEHAGAR